MIELTPIEKEKLGRFWMDLVLRDALKKVLLSYLEQDTILKYIDFTVTNAQIGENLRAMSEGIRILEIAFNGIAQYQPKQEEVNHFNLAR